MLPCSIMHKEAKKVIRPSTVMLTHVVLGLCCRYIVAYNTKPLSIWFCTLQLLECAMDSLLLGTVMAGRCSVLHSQSICWCFEKVCVVRGEGRGLI